MAAKNPAAPPPTTMMVLLMDSAPTGLCLQHWKIISKFTPSSHEDYGLLIHPHYSPLFAFCGVGGAKWEEGWGEVLQITFIPKVALRGEK